MRFFKWLSDVIGALFLTIFNIICSSVIIAVNIYVSFNHTLQLFALIGWTGKVGLAATIGCELAFIQSSVNMIIAGLRRRKPDGPIIYVFAVGTALVMCSNILSALKSGNYWLACVSLGLVPPVMMWGSKGIFTWSIMGGKDKENQPKASSAHITTRVDMTKVDALKVDTSALDIVTVDTSKVDTDKVDTAMVDTAEVDIVKVDMSKVDTSRVDMAKVDTSRVDTFKVDTQTVDIVEAVKANMAEADMAKVDKAEVDIQEVDKQEVDTEKVDVQTVDIQEVDAVKVDTKVDVQEVDQSKVDTVTVDITKVDTEKVDIKEVDTSKVDITKTKVDIQEVDKSKVVDLASRSNREEEINRVIEYALSVQEKEGDLPGRKRLKKETGCSEYIAKKALERLKSAG